MSGAESIFPFAWGAVVVTSATTMRFDGRDWEAREGDIPGVIEHQGNWIYGTEAARSAQGLAWETTGRRMAGGYGVVWDPAKWVPTPEYVAWQAARLLAGGGLVPPADVPFVYVREIQAERQRRHGPGQIYSDPRPW